MFFKGKFMSKLLAVIATLLVLTACEQQKQASAEVGAVPKKILDKATNDINNAAAVAEEQAKAAENESAPADEGK
jgi:hypothetical protein